MRKILVFTGALLFVITLGLGGWWSWPLLFPSLPDGWLSVLAKTDAALVQNRPDDARKVLEKTPSALPVAGWLQWEKRVHAVATATGAWAWAVDVATVAHAQYPGNPDLAAYLTWTLLLDKRPVEASQVASRTLPGTRWEGLASQASIEANGLASGDWSEFRRTLAEPSVASFQTYERLVALVPDPLVRKNALLTSLSRGDLDSAREHLGVLTPEQRDLPPFDRLQGLLAYDQGDWTRAAALLKRLPRHRPENLLVLADVYLHLGDSGQAELIYDQLLADFPDDPPLSLIVNRATLALDQGNPAQALAFLERSGPGAVSGVDRVWLLVQEARFSLGEGASVLPSLVAAIENGGESDRALEAELLKDRLFPDLVSVPRLWSLLHRHPDYGPVAERLTWLLLESQDHEGALRALDLHQLALSRQQLKEPWWSHFLRALILASEDRLEEADQTFALVPSAWRSAVFYADWALNASVLAQKTDGDSRKPWLENGLQRLTQALDLLPPSQDPKALKRRSLWLTRRGELAVALVPLELPALRGSLRSAAAEDFRQAAQLDADNLRASFLLRQTLPVTQEKP